MITCTTSVKIVWQESSRSVKAGDVYLIEKQLKFLKSIGFKARTTLLEHIEKLNVVTLENIVQNDMRLESY